MKARRALAAISAGLALAAPAAQTSAESRPLIGAIRWDAWYGDLPETARPPESVPYPGFDAARNRLVSRDPGKETRRSLAAAPWRYRWPFFTTMNADGSAAAFDGNRTDVIEREIDHAVRGGVDYWAFTAYPEASPLSYTLETFLACRSRDRIRFCLFVPMWPAYGRMPDEDAERAYWARLLRMVREPNYLKVCGNRPVLFMGFFNDALAQKVLDGPWPAFTKELAACGLGKPYLVFCDGSPKAAKKYCDMFGGDALSAYATCSSKAKGAPFAELAAHAESFWERCQETGTPAVPICMTGWDRRTRVMNPVSWESFQTEEDADQYFYKRGTPGEIAAHIGRGVEWFKKHPGTDGAELVLVYAWNEFDEGGWLAPALPPPDGEGAARLDALREVLAGDAFESSVSGREGAPPAGYVPPLVSNGNLCMLVDYQGGQSQRSYTRMTPGIWWAGRRYGPAHDQMVPFGHFEQELSLAGRAEKTPARWTQTLNTKEAVVACRNDYGDAVSVETVVFAHLEHDLVVVRKRISARDGKAGAARLTFRYQFTPPGDENRIPRRMICASALDEASRGVDFRYQVDGHRPFEGIVSVFCDMPVTAVIDKQAAALSADVTVDPARPCEMTFYLLFADSMDGKDYLDRAAQLKAGVRREGFDGMRASHRRAWGGYWHQSYVRIPDKPLEKAYCTAQYHLRANATRWSFPVGIFPTHWAGKFFGWDEMFCYQALISSNHRDIARRCPEFRFAGLQKALDRASHYGKPGTYGARFPWEALEDGTEGAPPGFWMEHVFHMSNIALSAWFHHLYTGDAAYLKDIGYPVIRECARFFLANMVYEDPDGGMFIGKCTDLERLGPARRNPFMTSCGAIYTLEAAAEAAALLAADADEAAAWRRAATKLRSSLPRDGERYVPYAGCKEESIASLGGLFPYPLFDGTEARQKNAVRHFVANGRASGNMYPVGQSVCAWYAGWMAAALAALGDRTEPVRMLDEAAAGAGCFGEMFEINEEKVSMHPWFSTASGNIVYALNQMLVQSRGNRILVAPAVPDAWNDFSFKLACHGDLVATAEAREGRITRLHIAAGDPEKANRRTVVIPKRLLDARSVNAGAARSVSEEGDCLLLDAGFKGEIQIVGPAPSASEPTAPIADSALRAKADEAWRAAWDRFYDGRTHLFYDYVTSRDPGERLAGLPTPEEIARQHPNPNGWGTGMEDCAISGGLMLSMICDRFEATGDRDLQGSAAKVFAGLKLLGTLSASEGFVIRGVCPADGKSHYCESSRDQYTWFAYGLWRYFRSPLSSREEKAAMRGIIAAICSRLERNVVPANGYRIGKETGAFDSIVDKMWENAAHEIARLPMIYAIGADLTGDSRWKDLARRYGPEAAAKSKDASTKVPYALLQQQVSLEALHALEESPELKGQWLDAMRLVAGRAQGFLERCLKYQAPAAGTVRLDWREWPLKNSMGYQVPTRPEALLAEERAIREPAEAALTLLLCPGLSLSPEQVARVKRTIAQVDYARIVYYGHYYTQAAYWRAVRLGVITLPEAPGS